MSAWKIVRLGQPADALSPVLLDLIQGRLVDDFAVDDIDWRRVGPDALSELAEQAGVPDRVRGIPDESATFGW